MKEWEPWAILEDTKTMTVRVHFDAEVPLRGTLPEATVAKLSFEVMIVTLKLWKWRDFFGEVSTDTSHTP